VIAPQMTQDAATSRRLVTTKPAPLTVRAGSTKLLLTLLLVVLGTTGCGGELFGKGVSASSGSIPPPVGLAKSDLVVIEDEPLPDGVVAAMVAATARPGEQLVIAAPANQVLDSSTSPSLAGVADPVLPRLAGPAGGSAYTAELIAWQYAAVADCYKGAPVPATPQLPSRGATSYQDSTDWRAVTAFAAQTASACRAARAASRARLQAWARVNSPQDPSARSFSLSAALISGVNMLGSLDQPGTDSSRVIVVFCSRLAGTVPAGSLNGDVVVVVSDTQPSLDATTAAEASLYGAGATSVDVVGPADPPGTLAGLVAAGLAARTIPVSLAGVLFANNSSRLLPTATARLMQALALLQIPGATAVVNGYASSTGNPIANLVLSQARAQSVATWLENRGVAASALLVIGHGAHDFIAPGPSPANRRVTLVIDTPGSQEPASASTAHFFTGV
jgi:outer membrane protein OmpA-like peptidoglycan-associated protein